MVNTGISKLQENNHSYRMAGICGILQKNDLTKKERFGSSLDKMMSVLGASDQQKRSKASTGQWHFGNVVPVSEKSDSRFIFNESLSVYCIVDGLVYIDETEKRIIQKKYRTNPGMNDYEYLPFLYHAYHAEFITHITGWHSIFILDSKNENAILCNDRLGLLPLFYYESDSAFVFASKLECIPASGLMNKIVFDKTSIAELLLYNYPVSDHTFIKEVSTLKSASIVTFTGKTTFSTYWSPAQLIVKSPANKKTGTDTIDEALEKAFRKPFAGHNNTLYTTLTGGFDGRLVLSYLLHSHRDRIHVFSFGAETSPDITIPEHISGQEHFPYTPFILDQDYMDHSFVDAACKTINYSNGLRSYKRSHYLHVMPQLSAKTNTVISGNFGDEVIKFSQILPSEVISQELISLLSSDFRNRPLSPGNGNQQIKALFNSDPFVIDELNSRLCSIEEEVRGYDNLSEKFNHLKFTRIAPKFFGSELSSYNDFVCNFSPFLDIDVLTAFSGTVFSGLYYPFNGNKLRHKEMANLLYAELIRRKHKTLLNYPTDRGFSISDLTNPLGKLTVLYKKKFNKKPPVKDPYFLRQSDELFLAFNKKFSRDDDKLPLDFSSVLNAGNADIKLTSKLASMNYWMSRISREYSVSSH